MNKKTIKDIDLNGKKVLLRCDLNVPLDENQNITDNTRIVAATSTINYLLDNNCKLVVTSHLGRPKGEFKPEFSLAPVAKELSRLIGREVKMAKDVIGDDAKRLKDNLQEGEIVLLENVRFHREETDNDPEFARKLAEGCDVFVNDAFGSAHRAHASTTGVASYLPAVAGFLMEKEIDFLKNAIDNPVRPLMAILGGSKVSDKIGVIDALLDKVDCLFIGGGMSYTFFKAQGLEVGNSICEPDKCDLAIEALEKARANGVKMYLPLDIRVAKEYGPNAEAQVVDFDKMPLDWEGMDIGPKTIELYSKELQSAKTVIWNGPVGVFEFDRFAIGTNSIAKVISQLDATTIIGGGDSAAATVKSGLADKMTHISTGGGASLELLEGRKLPGLEALQDK